MHYAVLIFQWLGGTSVIKESVTFDNVREIARFFSGGKRSFEFVWWCIFRKDSVSR